METQQYINKLKLIQANFMAFIDNEENEFEDLKRLIDNSNIASNKYDLKLFLYFLSSIANNYKRGQNLFHKIVSILSFYKNQITTFFTKSEIYQIFKENNRNLLSLIEAGILTNDDVNNSEYFTSDNKKSREKGENDSFLCELIRNDSVEQFIAYVNHKNYQLSSKKNESIYETNTFLLNKTPTLIEYAAFFGSIQIFNYLRMSKVQLDVLNYIFLDVLKKK